MDHGEDGTPDTTTNAAAIATTATVGEEEGVALNYSTMTRPTSKIQSSLIREAIMSNEENGMDETCSSTNGVFMDDGAATTNESGGSSHRVPQMYIPSQNVEVSTKRTCCKCKGGGILQICSHCRKFYLIVENCSRGLVCPTPYQLALK